MDIKEEILAQMDSALRPEFDKAIDNTIEGAFKEDVKTLGFMVANSIKCQWEVMKPHLFYAYCLGVKAQEAKAQAVPEQVLENNCMIGQAWFMRGTPVSALIKHAEKAYQAEVVAQNCKLEFGTDDNEHWFAHDVPFYGTVQIDRIEEHGLIEWDIHFNGCWQGPFDSKSECIKHLEECIAEEREAAQEPSQ